MIDNSDLLDADDDGPWRPLFSATTPLEEVVDILTAEALGWYRTVAQALDRDGVTLTADDHRRLARLSARQTVRALLPGYLRLLIEARLSTDGNHA